jgi:glutaredoxin 3
MKVTIYTKNDCIYCTKAKMLLTNKNISYNEMKLNEDFSRENLLELFPSAKTFPVIVIDGFNIGGYTELERKLLSEETNNTAKLLNEGF